MPTFFVRRGQECVSETGAIKGNPKTKKMSAAYLAESSAQNILRM